MPQGPFILCQSAALALANCSVAGPAATPSVLYRCADGRSFTVSRDRYEASVGYEDALYSLARRPSSIGAKYASPEAALIIDGDHAVFTSETIVDLKQCARAQ